MYHDYKDNMLAGEYDCELSYFLTFTLHFLISYLNSLRYEYVTSSLPQIISDNELIVPSHPYAARYRIIHVRNGVLLYS